MAFASGGGELLPICWVHHESATPEAAMAHRPALAELGLNTGKKARLHRILHEHGLRMPLIVWAYPRGSAIEGKGGRDSFYAVDYAARTASELGADVVKVNFPHPSKIDNVPGTYAKETTSQQAIDAVVRSAGRT